MLPSDSRVSWSSAVRMCDARFTGYPDQTQLAFREGMFRTGDIGYQDADACLYSGSLERHDRHGRRECVLRRGQSRIYQHPAVRETAVFGYGTPQWGELVMACGCLKPGTTVGVDELIAHCAVSGGLQDSAPHGVFARRAAQERPLARFSRGRCASALGSSGAGVS